MSYRGRRMATAVAVSVGLAVGFPTLVSAAPASATSVPMVPLLKAGPSTPEVAVPPIPAVALGVSDGQNPGQLLARAISLLTAGEKAGSVQGELSSAQATVDADTVTSDRAKASASASTAASTTAAASATAAAASAASAVERTDRARQLARQLSANDASLEADLRQAAVDVYMNGGVPNVVAPPVGRNVNSDAVIDAMVGEQVALSPQGLLADQRRAAVIAGGAAVKAQADQVSARSSAAAAKSAALTAQQAVPAARAAADRASQALAASGHQMSVLRQELSTLDAASADTLRTEAATIAQQAGTDLVSTTSLQFTPTDPLPAPMPTTTVALAWAFSELGKPYVYGATGPDTFDCSGLMQYVWNKAQMTIPRVAASQYSYTVPVPLADLRPGDLVFFVGSDGTRANPGHVGMYIGGGLMIDAPYTGTVVQVNSIWYSDLIGFGRVHSASTPVPAHSAGGAPNVVSELGTVPSQAAPTPGATPTTADPTSTIATSTSTSQGIGS